MSIGLCPANAWIRPESVQDHGDARAIDLEHVDPEIGDSRDRGELEPPLECPGSGTVPIADQHPPGLSDRPCPCPARHNEKSERNRYAESPHSDRLGHAPPRNMRRRPQVSGSPGPIRDMKPSTAPIQLWVALVLALGLALAPGAEPATTPLLTLGPIVVANDVATVSGTVAPDGGSTSVTVNGQPLGVSTSGTFQGVVPLDGASSITIGLTEAGSEQQTSFQIPLTETLLGAGGVIPPGVLDSLQQAGISLLTPLGVTSGEPLTVSGSVLDGSNLSSLTVNGKDVLGTLTPDGTFSVQLPGTTKVVTLTATDTNGNSATRRAGVKLSRLKATTVSAANALGVRIAKVRYYKTAALRKHRVRMVVTVKDRRGLLVRGAKISVRALKAGRLVRQPKAGVTGPKGRATFVLRLRAAAYGKRLVVVSLAKTPRAKASRKTAVFVPRRHR
jgi:hypothetical protein